MRKIAGAALSAFFIAAPLVAIALGSNNQGEHSALIGTWNVQTFSAIRNGKRFGTAHFEPGQWYWKFSETGEWKFEGGFMSYSKLPSAGTYTVEKEHIALVKENGQLHEKYRFKLRKRDSELVLRNERSEVQLTRASDWKLRPRSR